MRNNGSRCYCRAIISTRCRGTGDLYRLYRVNGGRTIRIVLIGVSHWHTSFYLAPSVEMKDVQLVGVSDPIPIRAATSLTQGGTIG